MSCKGLSMKIVKNEKDLSIEVRDDSVDDLEINLLFSIQCINKCHFFTVLYALNQKLKGNNVDQELFKKLKRII